MNFECWSGDGGSLDCAVFGRWRSVVVFCFLFGLAGIVWSAQEPDLDDEDADFVAKTTRIDQKSPEPASAVLSGAPAPTPGGGEGAAAIGDWAIPPIPYRGAITFGHDRLRTQDGTTATTNLGVNANATSYIYAPWFASLNGNVGFTKTKATDGGESDSASGTLSSSILPRSRFPGIVTAGVGRSHSSTFNSSNTVEFSSLQWNQAYAPVDAAYRSNWTYSHNSFGQSGAPKSRTDALNGALSLKPSGEAPQTLSLAGGASRASSAGSGGNQTANVSVNHSIYLEDYVMSIASDASLSKSEVRGADSSTFEFYQAGSQFDWIPSDDYPLRLRGGLRHHEVNTTQAGALNSERRLVTSSLNLAGDYPLNRNWSFSSFANVLRTANIDSAGNSASIVSSIGGAASWSGEGRSAKFDDWDYRLNYGSGLSVTGSRVQSDAGSSSSSALSVSGSVSQGLTRLYPSLGAQQPASLSLMQSYNGTGTSTSNLGDRPLSHSLSHSANYAWTPVPERPGLAATLAATDTRGYGSTRYQFQSIQGAANEIIAISAYESASWSVALPLTRQGGGGQSGRWQGTVSAGAGYSHGRFARVSGLRYSANYNLLIREHLVARQTVPFTGQESDGYEFEHRVSQSLAWRLGLLSWQLSNDITRSPGAGVAASIRLTVTRDFGGVL